MLSRDLPISLPRPSPLELLRLRITPPHSSSRTTYSRTIRLRLVHFHFIVHSSLKSQYGLGHELAAFTIVDRVELKGTIRDNLSTILFRLMVSQSQVQICTRECLAR